MSAQVLTLLLNWNNWADTLRCLECVLAMTYRNNSILVLDNGSCDESVVRLAAQLRPPHRLLRNPQNYGFARGCNVGLRWAMRQDVEYVWLLNNDTCPPPDALQELVNRAEQDAKIGAVGGGLCDMDSPQRIQEWGGSWLGLRTGLAGPNQPPPARERLDYICGGCMLIRTAALAQVGLFDEGYFLYGEDADLGLRLRSAGWRLAVASVRIPHRRGSSTGRLVQDFYSSAAGARLLRTYSSCPGLATILGTLRRMVKPALRGEFARVRAVAAGAVEGWRAFAERRTYRLPQALGGETGDLP
ncbi:MAG: glycosyltransferase family 2 protein [Terriglobales bacterium]